MLLTLSLEERNFFNLQMSTKLVISMQYPNLRNLAFCCYQDTAKFKPGINTLDYGVLKFVNEVHICVSFLESNSGSSPTSKRSRYVQCNGHSASSIQYLLPQEETANQSAWSNLGEMFCRINLKAVWIVHIFIKTGGC